MRIFILEDDPQRIKSFKQKLNKHYVVYCDNVEEAKKILTEDSFEVILFDHDLGGLQYVDSNDPNTGYQLAKWVRQRGLRFTQIIVHSQNPPGAQNIANEVRDCTENLQIIPFSVLINQLA